MFFMLVSIAGILLTIFFVVGTHESAHFFTARLLGVKVLRFSIGFGKTLFRWHDKKGTEYVFALVPLGGYVKMLDENEGSVPAEQLPFAFNRQPYYKRFLIVLAGPLMNILCALVLYWLIFVIGFVAIKPLIGSISPRSIAAEAGLKAHQEIVRIDDKPTLGWAGIMFRLLVHAGNQDHLKIDVKNPDNKIETHLLDLSNWHMDNLTPDPLSSLGITPYEPNIPLIIGTLAPNSPAATQLQLGDKIIAVNKVPVKDWDMLVSTINKHANDTLTFTIERNNKTLTLPITLSYKRNLLLQKSGYLGIGPKIVMPPDLLHKIQYGPLAAISHAWQQVRDFTYFNLLLFGKMITGKLSLQGLGGPITIFESAGSALNYGFISFLGFLAFLSISVGIINLLPIPGLDGGHLFIYLIELIIRRPVPEHVLSVMYRLGFLLIIFFLLQALVNDLLRLY
jgi:regulator of sigma E protease